MPDSFQKQAHPQSLFYPRLSRNKKKISSEVIEGLGEKVGGRGAKC